MQEFRLSYLIDRIGVFPDFFKTSSFGHGQSQKSRLLLQNAKQASKSPDLFYRLQIFGFIIVAQRLIFIRHTVVGIAQMGMCVKAAVTAQTLGQMQRYIGAVAGNPIHGGEHFYQGNAAYGAALRGWLCL